MTAEQDRLEEQRLAEVEAAAWRVPGATQADVDRILAAAEAYAVAVAEGRRPVISLPLDRPVHYQASPGRGACKARPLGGGCLTTDPGKVTCGNCHKAPKWREARAEALEAAPKPQWAARLDEFLGAAP